MHREVILIYEQLKIPPHLQRHMLRVAAVSEWIGERWAGPELNRELLRRVLLLHDLGNIVKGSYIDHPELLEEEAEHAEEWSRVQTEYVACYGSDDHIVSRALAASVGLKQAELDFMDAKVFVRNDETVKSSDYNLKIAAYSDQRVAPLGVLPLEERLRDAQRRYRDKPGSSMNNPRTEVLISSAFEIEAQIAKHCKDSLVEINDEAILTYVDRLKSYRL